MVEPTNTIKANIAGLTIFYSGHQIQRLLKYGQKENGMVIRAVELERQNNHNAQKHTHTHAQKHTLTGQFRVHFSYPKKISANSVTVRV